MKSVTLCLFAAALALSACDRPLPPFTAEKIDLPFMQIAHVSSKIDAPIFIQRIVANHNSDLAFCERSLGEYLPPHDRISLTFIGCGKITALDVYTDKGVFTLEL